MLSFVFEDLYDLFWFDVVCCVLCEEFVVLWCGVSLKVYVWGDELLFGVVLIYGFMVYVMCFWYVVVFFVDCYCVVVYDFVGMGDLVLFEDFDMEE